MDDQLAAQLCLRDAWPSPETADLGGWQLRAGSGGYNRANSVWPGRFSGRVSLEDAIDRVETFYCERRLTPRFQVLDIARPDGLDAELERRGYARDLACSDMTKPIGGGAMPADTAITGDAAGDWLDLYRGEQEPKRAAELPLILPRLAPRRGFIVCRRERIPAGAALVSRIGEDVAVDCVVSKAQFRRTGVARSLLRAAEAWAEREGGRRMLLSVVDGNASAVALYASLGYRKLAAYHYRFKTA